MGAAQSRESALQALLSDSNNAVVWPGLLGAMRAELPLVPVVGAMFQKLVGLPGWAGFLVQLGQEIGASIAKDEDANVANIVSRGGQMLLDDMIDARYAMTQVLEEFPATLALIPYLVKDVVIGSTMTREIEAAFAVANQSHLLQIRDLSSAADVSFQGPAAFGKKAVLLKLRGDLGDRNGRILTWAEYKERLHSSPQFESFLSLLVGVRRPLLFIGMSIKGSPLIDALPTTAEGMPPSYALLPSDLRDGQFTAWLYTRNIRPVWYRNGSGELAALLIELAEALSGPALQRPPEWPMPSSFTPPTATRVPGVATDTSGSPPTESASPPPDVPPGLLDAITAAECVAFVGSGLAARAGMPTWRGFVGGLVEEARTLGFMGEDEATQQRAALNEGEINSVADNAISAFSGDRDALLDYYRRASVPKTDVPRAIGLLDSIPFVGMLTTNYDRLLLAALPAGSVTLTPRDGDALLQAHAATSQPYLVQLYGDLDRPETVVTAPSEYQDLVRSNAAFARFIEGVFFSRTILFLGTSLEGLTDFLGGFRFPSGVPRAHYALVAVQGSSWQAKAQTLKRRYNIEVLAYPESPSFVQFDDFLVDLVAKVREVVPARVDVAKLNEPQLTRIELRNIGPYATLDLDFTKLRTILLGDNGVGKSSILKAIAMAIVGSEGRHYAVRLLKSGEASGSVRVMTRRNPSGYLAEIQRVGAEGEVISRSGRMLETEGWVALGFPPLRTTSWKPVSGPQGMGTKRPTAADLMPLLSGDVDSRMDDLKQWLVNTDAATRDERADVASREQAKRIFKTFLDAVGVLAEGLSVSFEEVTPDFRVLVRTRDGVVPIEALSQGMTSLLSWIGIVVQRLHEVNSAVGSDPMQSQALILMDEIDAHMHPAWQQKLLPRLKTLLPNVQIIASTHSPLVVAGLEASETVRFDRDAAGKVVRVYIEEDMTVGRADQILTGDLFGLDSTLALGEKGEAMQREYEELLARSSRSEEEEVRFAWLSDELVERIPPALAETKLERRSQALVRAVLTSDFSPHASAKVGQELAAKATAVMRSMGWKEIGGSLQEVEPDSPAAPAEVA